ncbi:MAG: hypothetical protein IJX24_06085 [Oscillospiraceae bacterium]|nr:hypothetical protein [Oscillospiraceae bacterium]
MDKKLKKLEEEQRRLMKEIDNMNGSSRKKSSSGSLMQFLIGLILMGAGLFWIFQSVRVSTGYGSIYRIGGWGVPNGTIIIPLLIGIVMLFVMERKIFGWIVTGIGIAVILVGIITSVRLHFYGTSLFEYILMFGFTLVGGGLVLKNLFKK